ncbi:MAG TPA: hypothetical protein VGT00_03990 [Methylomirabilota bacterium]|jgi:hypothetical protein|nr:hypothetical protein [Methylomirabilota bacterium]
MKRSAVVVLAVLLFGLLVFPVVPSYAWHGRGGVFIGVGPAWWGPPYPYWWYPPPYYPPAPVVIEQPPVYVEQPQTSPPPPPSAPPAYWYYCSTAQAYYPQAQSCPEAWIKVPARAQ